jgi:hypothetical protein
LGLTKLEDFIFYTAELNKPHESSFCSEHKTSNTPLNHTDPGRLCYANQRAEIPYERLQFSSTNGEFPAPPDEFDLFSRSMVAVLFPKEKC